MAGSAATRGDGGGELSGARSLAEGDGGSVFLLLLLLASEGRSWLLCVAATRGDGGDELSGARSLPEVTECRIFRCYYCLLGSVDPGCYVFSRYRSILACLRW